MATEVSITFKVLVVKEAPDMSVCDCCKEIIYSSNYIPCISIDGNIHKLDFKLCESCNELIDLNA